MKRRLFAIFLVTAAAQAAELRVVGSDLLGLDFSKELYAFAGRADLRLALALDGSRPGLDELKAGRADLGLLVFAPGEEAGAVAFERRTIAYHRVVILVPAAAPLEQLTLDQLGGIFGVGGPHDLSRWGELGPGPAWAASPITPRAPTAGAGLVAEYFRHAVLRDRAFKTNVVRYDQASELAAIFDGESRAIAFAAGLPSGATTAKLVALAARSGEPAFLPTLENVHSGDYPLGLPLALVFRRESAKVLLPLLRFLVSDEAAPLFERAELAPLPPAIRRQQRLALEK